MLASTTAIDIYKLKEEKSERHYLYGKIFHSIVGVVPCTCIGTLFENLIQLVNIIGSIFYGTVLGVFLVGFISNVQSKAIFYSAVISQLTFLLSIIMPSIFFPVEEKNWVTYG
jgi:hypothetical protein